MTKHNYSKEFTDLVDQGLESYLEKTSFCPVNYYHFEEFQSDVWRDYMSVISNIDSEKSNIFLSITHVLSEIIYKCGYFKYFYSENEKMPSFSFLSNLNVDSLSYRLKRKLVVQYRNMSTKRNNCRGQLYSYPGGMTQFFESFKDFDKAQIYPLPLFVTKKHQKSCDIEDVLDDIMIKMALRTKSYLSFDCSEFLERSREYLLQSFIQAKNVYINININKLKESALFIKCPGRLISRLFAMKAMRDGIPVYSAIHGFNTGIQSALKLGLREFEASSIVLSPSKESTRLLKGYYSNSAISTNKPIQFKNDTIDEYIHIYNQVSDAPVKSKRVYVVEGPVKSRHFSWHFNLVLHYLIGHALKKMNNISSFLKKRPDNQIPNNFYGDLYDKEITENFEDVMSDIDILIFPYVETTTFGYALLTNKPIIIFEHLMDRFDMSTHSDIRKRCIVIPSSFDGQKLTIDEISLISCIDSGEYLNCNRDATKKYFMN